MRKITLLFVTIISSFLLLSCGKPGKSEIEKMKKELINIDIAFSNYSEKNGMNEAFINYVADDGVLLRPYSKPIVGKDNVTALLNKNKGKKKKLNITLKWEPQYADIAASGDLGFTYGIYTLSVSTDDGNSESEFGTYVTIWKKDKDGNWKYALDTGNEGLEPRKEKKNNK